MRYLLLFFFLLTGSIANAKPDTIAAKKLPAVIRFDTASVTLRHVDTAAINNYKKQKEFIYKDDYSGPSLWTRFWRWFWSLFDWGKTKTGYSNFWKWAGVLIKYVIIIGGIAALILVILKSAGIDINIFRKGARKAGIAYTELDENIHQIDFEKDIEAAAAAGNYKLAVRLLYLHALKQLSDSNLIDWQPNKTNQAYVEELNNNPAQGPFKNITRQFEYVWYGDFAVTGSGYSHISKLFADFKGGRP